MYLSEKGVIITPFNTKAVQSLRNTNLQAPETVSDSFCGKSPAMNSGW